MNLQCSFTPVINKFLDNKECIEDFIESLEIPNLKPFKVISACFLKDYEFTSKIIEVEYKSNKECLEGFVVIGENTEIIYLSHSYGYMNFWGARNFFGYKCGQKHSWKNDGKVRYLVNVLPYGSRTKNLVDTYDIFKNYYVYNIVLPSENLKNWLNTLYY